MEPEGSLLCSQDPIMRPYSEPDESSSHLHSLFLKINVNITLPSTTRSLKVSDYNFVSIHISDN
jgi:hypothetical protein